MEITPEQFLSKVEWILNFIGYKNVILAENAWLHLFKDGLSPLQAVLVNEFDYEGNPALGWRFIQEARGVRF